VIQNLAANQSITVLEGKGVTATEPIIFMRPAPEATPTPTPQ
jgi:hypothetical protein